MKVLAHRGAVGPARENTLAAFAAALELGADGVETDVRATQDDVLVLHHDRLLADGRPLAAVPWSVLEALPETRRPCRLEAALAAFPGLHWNLELKERRAAPALERLLAHARPRALLVSSFDHPAVAALALPAGARRGALVAHRPDLARPGALPPGPGAAGGVDALVVDFERLDAALVAAAAERGLACWTWGPTTQAEHDGLVALALEGLITDHVRRAVPRPPPRAPA